MGQLRLFLWPRGSGGEVGGGMISPLDVDPAVGEAARYAKDLGFAFVFMPMGQ